MSAEYFDPTASCRTVDVSQYRDQESGALKADFHVPCVVEHVRRRVSTAAKLTIYFTRLTE
jgi:hypothetical protein